MWKGPEIVEDALEIYPLLRMVKPSIVIVEEALKWSETWKGPAIVEEAFEMNPPPTVRSPAESIEVVAVPPNEAMLALRSSVKETVEVASVKEESPETVRVPAMFIAPVESIVVVAVPPM